MTTRTHILLFPYGTPDGVRQVLASNDPARIKRVTDGYTNCGWRGCVHHVRASGFQDATRKLALRLGFGQEPCPPCSGTGGLPDKTACSDCLGTGRVIRLASA